MRFMTYYSPLFTVIARNLIAAIIINGTFFGISYSQKPGRSETLKIINESLGLQGHVELKFGNLIITYKNEQGETIREDKAPIAELVTDPVYEQSSGLVCIPCLTDVPDCVMKSLFIQKVRNPAGRMTIKMSDQEKAASLIKYLQHLIKIESEVGYKDEI